MKLPKYSNKDYYVLALILLPVSVALSYAIMGNTLFANFWLFASASIITATVFGIYFTLCSGWAFLMKRRFRQEADIGKKLFFMIMAFLVMSGFVLLLIFYLFERVVFVNYKVDQSRFIWAYFGLGFVNIFLSFLFEGISRFEEWKSNLQHKEQLQKAFQQSQLQALRSQVNPHFLFNSLNCLSCLIEEDADAAELFLNEMSKVYRYMLRPETEQLVPVKTEIQFLQSYFHLLKIRFGESLQTSIDIAPAYLEFVVPTLTLQIIIEQAIHQNTMSIRQPLLIKISTTQDGKLLVRHNINLKTKTGKIDAEVRLDSLIMKYKLLEQQGISVQEEAGTRTILIPFVNTIKATRQ